MTTPSRAVFLSYASEDAAVALHIADALRAAGIEVWIDRSELRGGDAWDRSIREKIDECALFVPVISASAHARIEGYFRLEWKLAVDRSHRMAPDQAFLLPVAIDETSQADKRIPDRFRELQWTRLPDGVATPAFLERVRRLLSPESSAAGEATLSGSTGALMSLTSVHHPWRSSVWLAVTGAVIAVALAVIAVDRFLLSRSPQLTMPSAQTTP